MVSDSTNQASSESSRLPIYFSISSSQTCRSNSLVGPSNEPSRDKNMLTITFLILFFQPSTNIHIQWITTKIVYWYRIEWNDLGCDGTLVPLLVNDVEDVAIRILEPSDFHLTSNMNITLSPHVRHVIVFKRDALSL
jgi:hypothetical protein